MNNQNFISLDETKFKKSSKKLTDLLNSHLNNESFKLSQIQEILSKSLGFRNFFELQQNIFNKSDNHFVNKISNNHKINFFDNLNASQILSFLTILLSNSNANDFSQGRAISLLSTVITYLVYLRETENISINSSKIKEFLQFDKLFKTYKYNNLPQLQTDLLSNYFLNLPGFNMYASKQESIVEHTHIPACIQLIPMLNKLSEIENDNFVFFNKKWFEIIENKQISSQKGGSDRMTETNYSINTFISPKKEILKVDFIESSWLSIPQYETWLNSVFYKPTNIFYISDFIIYISKIISPIQKSELIILLNSILNNYYEASSISKDIEKIF